MADMTPEQIAAAIAAKMVAKLEWDAGERDQRQADSILGEFCVTFFGGKWFYQGEPHKGMLEAQAAAQSDYQARMIAGMDRAVLVGLVEAAIDALAYLTHDCAEQSSAEPERAKLRAALKDAGVVV